MRFKIELDMNSFSQEFYSLKSYSEICGKARYIWNMPLEKQSQGTFEKEKLLLVLMCVGGVVCIGSVKTGRNQERCGLE